MDESGKEVDEIRVSGAVKQTKEALVLPACASTRAPLYVGPEGV